MDYVEPKRCRSVQRVVRMKMEKGNAETGRIRVGPDTVPFFEMTNHAIIKDSSKFKYIN